MLNVVEFSLREPVGAYPFFRLGRHLEGATARVFEQGDGMDITDDRWPNKTHQWYLQVRSDGIGVLTIRPSTERSSIVVASRSLRPERIKEVTHVLTRPAIHLLMGVTEQRSRPVVFKAVCALPDDHEFMQHIRNARPRRV